MTGGSCSAAVTPPKPCSRVSTGSPRSSSVGCWAPTRARSAGSISTTTSTSSRSGSTAGPHATAASCSTASWSKPWPWTPCPTPRWSRAYGACAGDGIPTGRRYWSQGNTPKGDREPGRPESQGGHPHDEELGGHVRQDEERDPAHQDEQSRARGCGGDAAQSFPPLPDRYAAIYGIRNP